MNFLSKAQISYYRINCQAIRSVLYECAAEALRQLLEFRKTDRDGGSTASSSSTTTSPVQDRIEISHSDIEECYKFARTIGRRWADKLFMTDDEPNRQIAKMITLILDNGEFFDESFTDDFMSLLLEQESSNHHVNNGSSEDSDDDDWDCPLQNDAVANHPNEGGNHHLHSPKQLSVARLIQQDDHSHIDATTNTTPYIHKSIPYATLLNIGELDPCHLSAPKDMLQSGTAVDWKPLRSALLPNSNCDLVHIPLPEIMPLEEREEIHKDQLYGRPALVMSPKMNVRQYIAIIDQMGEQQKHDGKGDDGECKGGNTQISSTMWPHDWKIIQYQAKKNRDRLHPVKVQLEEGKEYDEHIEEVVEIIPKSLLRNHDNNNYDDDNIDDDVEGDDDGEGDNNVEGDDNMESNIGDILQHVPTINTDANADVPFVCVEHQTFKQSQGDSQGHISAMQSSLERSLSTWTCKKIARRRKTGKRQNNTCRDDRVQLCDKRNSSELIKGRKPSIYGQLQWSMQDIKRQLGQNEMDMLDATMVHIDDESSSVSNNTCQGYLKTLGNIHLFEQIRVGKWRGFMDEIPIDTEGDGDRDNVVGKDVIKMRKKAHRKAKRQRLYPNYEEGTKGYQDSKLKSKILRVTEGKEGMRLRNNVDLSDEQENQCMELDLGECILSLAVKHVHSDSSTDVPVPVKMMMAFRSIEVSLSEA